MFTRQLTDCNGRPFLDLVIQGLEDIFLLGLIQEGESPIIQRQNIQFLECTQDVQVPTVNTGNAQFFKQTGELVIPYTIAFQASFILQRTSQRTFPNFTVQFGEVRTRPIGSNQVQLRRHQKKLEYDLDQAQPDQADVLLDPENQNSLSGHECG